MSELPSPSPASQPSDVLPCQGALLALDYGMKRWGVAVCNREQTIAVPVETWNVRSVELNRKYLQQLIRDYMVVGIVVGLPVRLNGVEGDQAAIVRQFGQWVKKATSRPVDYWDERYSSTEAEVLLWSRGISPSKAKGRLDQLAAQIILQSYLDASDRRQAPQPLQG